MDIQITTDKCLNILDEMKAKDTVVLDVQGKMDFCDRLIISTANNPRHLFAIVNALIDAFTLIKRKAVHKDGDGQSGWMVTDFGDVVVHVFLEHVRHKYDLESLWTTEYEDLLKMLSKEAEGDV
ncbi:ribosome silencing factor [PVC group bacterium (ex Bugula neritina AB1)]|nr:ribosome silencing factor [PVC group bacterium (ex Bugula neritina AB1)]